MSLILRRQGLGRLAALDPKPTIVRYQRERPGELVHIDIKKLGKIDGIGHRITGNRASRARGVGWDFLHVCVDDASRLAYTEILPDERKESAVGFLKRALAWFATLGVAVERVMTDNGSAYRSHRFRDACETARVKHKRTRPYTPRTNGKAERFIQTSIREWAYRQAFTSSAQRAAAMRPWLHAYNRHRPHSALGGSPPFTRLTRDNLLGNDTYTWGGDSDVTFELTPKDAGVLLVLTHRRLPSRDRMLSIAAGWHAHLGILSDRLAGREPRPFWSTHSKLEAEYERLIPAA